MRAIYRMLSMLCKCPVSSHHAAIAIFLDGVASISLDADRSPFRFVPASCEDDGDTDLTLDGGVVCLLTSGVADLLCDAASSFRSRDAIVLVDASA